MINNKVKYIWNEKQGQARNLYCMFRKNIEVKGVVRSREIKMFADTHY